MNINSPKNIPQREISLTVFKLKQLPHLTVCATLYFPQMSSREAPYKSLHVSKRGVSSAMTKKKKKFTQEKWLFLLTPPLSCFLFHSSASRVSVSVPASARLHDLHNPSGSLNHCCSFSTCSLALTYAWCSIPRRCK